MVPSPPLQARHSPLFGLAFLLLAPPAPADVSPAIVGTELASARELLRTRIEEAGHPPAIEVGPERVHASLTLPRFYLERGFGLAWSDGRGPNRAARELVAEIRAVHRHGLRPDDYHLRQIDLLLDRIAERRGEGAAISARWFVDLDLLLTDAYLIYGAHLLSGRVDPVGLDPQWTAVGHGVDLAAHLEAALGERRVRGALAELVPPHVVYWGLQEALERYRRLAAAAGWPRVDPGPALRRGDEGPRVVQLRDRLRRGGDLEPGDAPVADEAAFDETLDEAVRAFQRRHGLAVDGVVGPATLAAFNVSAPERVRQIEVNLERWRWLPRDLGRRHVRVNIAGFTTEVVEEGRTVLAMRSVVGRLYRRTPVFSAEMTYLVFSPYWHVPRRLAVEDLLPVARREGPDYFARNGVQVFRGWGAETERIDPATVDWAAVTPRDFDFRFRQDPGPLNSLGKVKFMFPNRFHVYLHDTPAREQFDLAGRAFSSGCIRVEKPLELAHYLMRGDPRWDRQRIMAAMDRGVEQTVVLPERIPVHILYWTAWEAEGQAHFRADVYERDGRVAAALELPPPRR